MPTDIALGTLQRAFTRGLFKSSAPNTSYKGVLLNNGVYAVTAGAPTYPPEPDPSDGRSDSVTIMTGSSGPLPFGNIFVMMFHGQLRSGGFDSDLPRTATVRLWGMQPLNGSDDYAGTPLGDLKLKLGNTGGKSGTDIPLNNRFVCDVRVVPPDISLTPPGIRVMGQNASQGAAHVVVDSLGFTHIVAQLRIDANTSGESNIVNLSAWWRSA
ncbi:MAG: hypothetical protein KF705_00275 [Phycisphaeraceae bacterium]|nr:hypothetical protein [Phycisphaeraceae bacterium]